MAKVAAAFRLAYRAQQRRQMGWRLAFNLIGVLIFLAVWEAVPRVVPWINTVLFPPPSQVVETLGPMLASGEIARNIMVSVGRAGAGFLIAAVLGIAAGVATARLRGLQHLTEPLLHGFRAIPVIALVPLSVLWFGIGETAKVALVATGAFFPIWIATFIGVRDVHIIYLRSAACLGAGRIATMFWVILPAALPLILAGLRQAMAISLIVLVAAELSGATAGVAYMMSMGHQLFRVDVMFIGLVLLGTLGFVFDRLFVLLTRRLFPWYTTAN
jgi:ABC-type nitrate/sulfonate/bicarbonate transport system permease component